jgi:hypothetical protein
MIWYGMIWYMIYMIWYDMIWYDMIWYDMIWYDMIWYMIWYDMIWYDNDMIWYMIRYDMIWYDMVWYDTIRYDTTWHDMIWYDMIYNMIWYDMIWYDMIWYSDWVRWLHVFERKCPSQTMFAVTVALRETPMPVSKPAKQQDRLTRYSLQVNGAVRMDAWSLGDFRTLECEAAFLSGYPPNQFPKQDVALNLHIPGPKNNKIYFHI